MLFTIMDDDASLRVGILLLGHQYPSLLRFYPWSDSAAAAFPKYIFSYRSVSFEYSRQPKQHINQSESYFSVLSISIAAPWGVRPGRVLEVMLGNKAHDNCSSCFLSSFYLYLFHQLNSYEVHFRFLRDNLFETRRPAGGGQSNCPNLMPVSFYL